MLNQPVLPLKRLRLKVCSFQIERTFNFPLIAGVDEVGRGCLAGPVCVAGVVFPARLRELKDPSLDKINDSKKLTSELREELVEFIRAQALATSTAFCTNDEIDSLNILQATFKAARIVVADLHRKLGQNCDMVMMDGHLPISGLGIRQHTLIGGDGISKSIAAASILAKVTRDRWMTEVSSQYPQFGFERHKGYATEDHRKALSEFGATSLHRKSFIKKIVAVELGKDSEDLAADYLSQKDFKILERNWKCPWAEVDLVAQKDSELHFFEVRSRSGPLNLEMAFPPSKQAQFKRACESYRMKTHSNLPYRLHFLYIQQGRIQPFWDVFQF